ncbi:EamA family transporter RarD [Actinomycetospora sp. NBRC 106378]|uniref:EamA family transporter RarD n=1 Tax=Actinomycetospora sp. NBRC 106378 TaxID=3032208 RepID=UPI0024A3B622|nr:EamA family transporter RarD [Actinomycetospora sp. NBRC 106378]GLZ50892.1 putative RarD protein [Actinomycetospora sp. NBRC 106378]
MPDEQAAADPTTRPPRSGLVAALGAYVLWGAFPAFWPLLAPAGSVEILAHRIAWTLVGMLVVLTAMRGWSQLRGQSARTWLTITVASVLITINWGVYIWGVTHDRVVESALGYYVNPLVSVVLAVLVLGERLRRVQWVAVGIATVAVAVLWAGTGALPWVALVLAGSFGVYGLLKKRVPLAPVAGLTAEGFLLGPLAIGYLVWLQAVGVGTFGQGTTHTLLLVAAGPVTALPLLLFAFGAQRLPLATLGLLQYVNPTLQFVWGVFVEHEPMPPARWTGFVLVWVALLVFAVDGWTSSRRRGSGPVGTRPAQPTRSTV